MCGWYVGKMHVFIRIRVVRVSMYVVLVGMNVLIVDSMRFVIVTTLLDWFSDAVIGLRTSLFIVSFYLVHPSSSSLNLASTNSCSFILMV